MEGQSEDGRSLPFVNFRDCREKSVCCKESDQSENVSSGRVVSAVYIRFSCHSTPCPYPKRKGGNVDVGEREQDRKTLTVNFGTMISTDSRFRSSISDTNQKARQGIFESPTQCPRDDDGDLTGLAKFGRMATVSIHLKSLLTSYLSHQGRPYATGGSYHSPRGVVECQRSTYEARSRRSRVPLLFLPVEDGPMYHRYHE